MPLALEPKNFGYVLNLKAQGSTYSRESFHDLLATEVFPELQVVPTNVGSSGEVAGKILQMGATRTSDAVRLLGTDADEIEGNNTKAAIHIAVVGEKHDDSDDQTRALKLTKAAAGVSGSKRFLLVEERGRKNVTLIQRTFGIQYQKDYVNEFDLTANNFTEVQRSAAIAGYIFLYLADGDQRQRRRVLVIIGDNHRADVISSLEHFITTSKAWPHVKCRPRVYFAMASQG